MKQQLLKCRRYLLTCGGAVLILAAGGPAAVFAQLSNPIPQPIVKQGLRVQIQNVVQMPSTQATLGSKSDYSPGARARINFMSESPDGRRFVNDLRGQLYSLDANNVPQLYFDLDSANGGAGSIFPAMRFTDGLAAGFVSFEFHPDFAHVGSEGYGQFYTIHMESAASTSAVPDFATVDQRSGSHPVKYHTVINEWKTPTPLSNTWNAAQGTRRELLRVGTTADAYFHPYGDLEFNPLANPGDADYGKLYISGGDWGYINGAGAPQGTPTEGQPTQLQRLDTLAGTLLRIDPRSPSVTGGVSGKGDYTIPTDNPFVDGNSNTFDEIYAFGFRNGHRMAWDQSDGSLYVMSVGHANVEEIERIIPGGNYGWGMREGTFINGNDVAHGGNGDADDVFTNNISPALDVDFRGQPYLYPTVQYDHGEGNAIAGGFVYEGSNVPQLQGKYIFGDIVNGRLFAADMDAIRGVDITNRLTTVTDIEEIQLYTVAPNGSETNVSLRDLVGNSRTDLRFGADSTGEIVILTKTDGYLRTLVGQSLERLKLTVDRATGAIRLSNPTDGPIEIDSYSILSATGSLDPANGKWQSFADQSVSGWMEAAPVSTELSELNPLGSSVFAASDERSLGQAYAPNPPAFGVSVSDLQFTYSSPTGQTYQGIIEYVGDDTSNNLVLTVNTGTGEATLENASPFDVSIDAYSILSESGALKPGNGDWSSLADQAVNGWQESGPTSEALSELNPLDGQLLASGAEYEMGGLFDVEGNHDLEFSFSLVGDESMAGVVIYQLTGDYNDDGIVNAADYTVWRDAVGSPTAALANRDPSNSGAVDADDYAVWKANYGNSSDDGVIGEPLNSVPEPSAGLIVLSMLVIAGLRPPGYVRREHKS